MRHNPGYGIMAQFVQCRPVPIHRLEIGLRRRHPNIVCRDIVGGAISADAQIGTGRFNQRLGARQDEAFRDRGCACRDTFRQAFALIDIEDCETLQKWDRTRLVTVSIRALAFVARNETVGVNDRGAALAFAHVAAK
jgi:hypothetical protein